MTTYNKHIPMQVIENYGASRDSRGRVTFTVLKVCTVGKDKGKPVWTRVISRLVPDEVKRQLSI